MFRFRRPLPALLALACLGALLVLLHRSAVRAPVSRHGRLLMGTACEISFLVPPGADPGRVAAAGFAEIERLENLWSLHCPDSELSLLNRAGRAAVSPETRELLRLAGEISRLTGGAFDITVKPLLDAWRAGEAAGTVPDHAPLLPLVDYRGLAVEGDEARFRQEGMQADPGALGKGLAADLAAEKLRSLGVKAGIVNIGGDMAVFGPGPHRGRWRIGIRCPRGDGLLGTLWLTDRGVATSGDYRRYFEIAGRRYSHIVDPRSGRLAEPPQSVTVVAPGAGAADALATAAAVLGAEAAVELFDGLEGVEGLVVAPGGTVFASAGFEALAAPPGRFFPLE